MPAINDLNYTVEELLLAQFGRAISHPARARMFFHLMNKGTFRNVDFSKQYDLSTSTAHNHIYKLKDADLINLEYVNHQYYVTLNHSTIEMLLKFLQFPESTELNFSTLKEFQVDSNSY